MAGNSKRRGAVKKKTNTPKVGSGGVRRRALEGKGPTPKAEDRTYHPAAKRKVEAEKRQQGTVRPVAKVVQELAKKETIYGRNSVLEALKTKLPAVKLLIANTLDVDQRVRQIITLAGENQVPLKEVSNRELDEITERGSHQGVLLEVQPYVYQQLEDLLDQAAESNRPPLFVALDGVTDPRNLGAIIRSAAGFGAHGVIIPARRSAGMNAAAWKVSAGAAAHLPVAQVTNLARALEELKTAGIFAIGLAGEESTELTASSFLNDPLVIVVGSEGKGISRLVRATCDELIGIEMGSDIESLNAAVATSIALYEVAKQRKSN